MLINDAVSLGVAPGDRGPGELEASKRVAGGRVSVAGDRVSVAGGGVSVAGGGVSAAGDTLSRRLSSPAVTSLLPGSCSALSFSFFFSIRGFANTICFASSLSFVSASRPWSLFSASEASSSLIKPHFGQEKCCELQKKCKKHKSCAVHIISTISHQRNAVKISRTHM